MNKCCVINESDLRTPPKGEGVSRRTNHVTKGLELSVPTSNLQGGERGWRSNQQMANDLGKYDYVVKPPKNPKGQLFGLFLENFHAWGTRTLPRATQARH